VLSVGYLVTPSVHALGDGQSSRRDRCYGPHLYGEVVPDAQDSPRSP